MIIKRRISPSAAHLQDPGNATFGARLRFLRKQLNLTIAQYATKTGLAHGTIARIERDETRVLKPWVLGKILPFVVSRFKEAFPESGGDPYDFLMPPTSFGAFLKNLRLRRGLQQKELARLLAVNRESIRRYEGNLTKPEAAVRTKLRKAFRLDGELDRFL